MHRFRLQQQLERVDVIEQQIIQLEAEMEKQNTPFQETVKLLAETPGFDRTTAWSVIADLRAKRPNGEPREIVRFTDDVPIV